MYICTCTCVYVHTKYLYAHFMEELLHTHICTYVHMYTYKYLVLVRGVPSDVALQRTVVIISTRALFSIFFVPRPAPALAPACAHVRSVRACVRGCTMHLVPRTSYEEHSTGTLYSYVLCICTYVHSTSYLVCTNRSRCDAAIVCCFSCVCVMRLHLFSTVV